MFTYNPLVLGELHNDLVTMQWVVDNIDKLYKLGYHCFAYEYDQNIQLDSLIQEILLQIEIIKRDYQDPKILESCMMEQKRKAILNLFGAEQCQYASLSTEELLDICELSIPDVRRKFAARDAQIIEIIHRSVNALAEKELALKLFTRIKELGMSYVGLDEVRGELRSTKTLLNNTFDSEVSKRDFTLVKRLAVSATVHQGGIIALVGARHLVGIAKMLPAQFELPLLKAEQENIKQFRFTRIMSDKNIYNVALEHDLGLQLAQLSKDHSWFHFEKVQFKESETLLNDLITDKEDEFNPRASC